MTADPMGAPSQDHESPDTSSPPGQTESPPRTPGLRKDRKAWGLSLRPKRIAGVVATLVGFMAAVVTIAAFFMDYPLFVGQSQEIPSPSLAEPGIGSPGGDVIDSSTGSQTTPASSTAVDRGVETGAPCGDEAGFSLACSDHSAWLILGSAPCDETTASQRLGVDPLVMLDLRVSVANGACLIRPGHVALDAGATAAAVLTLTEGTVPSELIVCAADAANADDVTPCSQPHRLEFVDKPMEGDPATADAKCKELARRYVDGPLDQASNPLSTVVFAVSGDTPRFQCAIASSRQLNGSVFELGGRQLPLAP